MRHRSSPRTPPPFLDAAASGFSRAVARVLALCRLVTLTLIAWLTVILIVSVVMRVLFGTSIAWVEESSSILLVWLMLFVAPLGFHERFHITVGLMSDRTPRRVRILAALLANLCTAAFFAVTLYFGTRSTLSEFDVRLVSLPFARGWVTWVLPVASAAIIAVSLDNVLTVIRLRDIPHDGAGPAG